VATVPILSPGSLVQDKPIAPGYQSASAATPDAFGYNTGTQLAAAGKGATALGSDALDLATRQQADDNDRALKQADVTLADKVRTITFGDGTADNPGYYSQRGDNAVDGAPSTMAAIQQAQSDVMGGIQNQRVKNLFSSVAQQRVVSAQQGIGSFLDQQRLVANVGASQARVGSTINDAASSWNDPKQLATSLAVIGGETAAQGQLQGWSPDEVKQKAEEAKASLFANVIKAAGRTGDYQTAEKIFQDNLDNIPGSAQGLIERELRTDQRAARMDQQLAYEQSKRAAADAQQKAVDTSWRSIVQPDGTIAMPANFASSIVSNPAIHAEVGAALIGAAERVSKAGGAVQSTPGLLHQLAINSLLPDDDPSKTTPASVVSHAGLDLSNADVSMAMSFTKPENVGDTRTMNDSLASLQQQLVPGYLPGAPTPASTAVFQKLDTWFYNAVQQGKAQGKSVNSMLDPSSKDYIVTPAVLQQLGKPTGDDVTGPSVISRVTSYLKSLPQYNQPADPLAVTQKGDLAPKAETAGATVPGKAPVKGRPSLDDIFGGK
jgi:hypothetical protein